jgi:hypothetical protein
MYSTSRGLASYQASLKLPIDLVKSFETQVNFWVQHSGKEWTVNRLKTIYTDFIRFNAGLPLVGKWYKKNKLGLPSGILSRIFHLSKQSKRKHFACGTLLRIYTRYLSHQPTHQQISKWISGVNAEDITIPSDVTIGVCDAASDVFGKVWVKPNQASYLSYVASPGKRVPLKNGKTSPEDKSWYYQWETVNNTKTGRYLKAKYQSIFDQVYLGFEQVVTLRSDGSNFSSFGISTGFDTVGKIGLIQEPGFKLRAVANPNRVYQVALDPLKQAVSGILKNLPWDCTFDQSKAIPFIQNHLKAENRCHCIDLSGATDYFPLSLQISVLKRIFSGLDEYIDLFADLSRSDWNFQDTTIRWTKGQPLGLGPSFVSFALTHGLVLYYLNNYSFNEKFFILGDDVIIMDDTLALKYFTLLKEMGCPISESKTLSSKITAEFAGKIISRDVVEPQLKWRLLSDDNFCDVVKLLGIDSLLLLRPQQRKVVKAICDIPDFVGGIGFNPDGIPLEVRYEKYLSLMGNDLSTFLTSYDRRFSQFFYSSDISANNVELSQKWDETSLPDLDQRSAALALRYLPSLNKMYGVLGANLYSVVPNKDVLPIDGETSQRKTLLAILQRKLGW